MAEPICDVCGKPAVWKIKVLTRTFYRCKKHRHLMSKEFQNHVLYNKQWLLVWDVFEDEDCWNSDDTMDDVRRKGLKKLCIPTEDYL